MTERHADNCDYHCDQYPWECTCGLSNHKEPDTMSNETQTTETSPNNTDVVETPDVNNAVAAVTPPTTHAEITDTTVLADTMAQARAAGILDKTEAEPATPVMEGYLSGGGIVVTKDFTPQADVDVDIVIDHQRRLDCEADYRASQSSNAPAAEPETLAERADDLADAAAADLEAASTSSIREADEIIADAEALAEAMADEPAPEPNKVWNKNLQAWV